MGKKNDRKRKRVARFLYSPCRFMINLINFLLGESSAHTRDNANCCWEKVMEEERKDITEKEVMKEGRKDITEQEVMKEDRRDIIEKKMMKEWQRDITKKKRGSVVSFQCLVARWKNCGRMDGTGEKSGGRRKGRKRDRKMGRKYFGLFILDRALEKKTWREGRRGREGREMGRK